MTDVIWEQRDFADSHADPLTGARAELVANLAAVTRVLLGLPTTTGTRARVLEEPVAEIVEAPALVVPEPLLEPVPTALGQVPAADPFALPPLLEVAPLVEVEPLVGDLEPLPLHTEPEPQPEPQPESPVLDVRSAAAVLDELRFLDD